MIQQQLPQGRNGGGGGGGDLVALTESSIVVRRTAAIGDSLCATVVADRLIDLGYTVDFQAHTSMHCVLRRHHRLNSVMAPGTFCHVDLDQSYERDPQRRIKHFHVMFFEAAQRQLLARGVMLGQPTNCTPTIHEHPTLMAAARANFAPYPKPWIFVCPRSDSYNVRQVPDGIWEMAASEMQGTKFWLGRYPAPKNFIDLKCQHFDNVISYLSVADLLVSVDTGPMHVAAALGIPIVAIGQSSSPELHLSDQRDFITIEPKLQCLNCQANVCPVNQWHPPCQSVSPEFIAAWTNAKLRIYDPTTVSAVIPILRPPADRLNRCLNSILDQVMEIVVSVDGAGRIPEGALRHQKIRYVTCRQKDCGYAKNVNFGARHTTGHWLYLLNDDAYPAPDAVKHLLACGGPDVGVVGHLLRFPDGTIQHGGKFREPGMRGWGHYDGGKRDSSVHTPIVVENVTGASILVRRSAFYKVKANDEDFPFYSVDDALCLSMRQAGYKIIFTPFAEAIHEQAATTSKDQRIVQWVKEGNAMMEKKWGWYYDQNINTIPGKF